MIAKNQRFKKKISYSSLFFTIFLIVLTLTILIFLFFSNWKMNQRRAKLKSQIESLKKEIQILEEKNQKLKARILESENEYFLEKKAREDLGLKKPEEDVLVVLPPEKVQNEEKKEKDFWQKILDPLKNFFK